MNESDDHKNGIERMKEVLDAEKALLNAGVTIKGQKYRVKDACIAAGGCAVMIIIALYIIRFIVTSIAKLFS